jgi:ElaB/YqjD/DUF883 family membrane-anchored ribosome-binding protein
MSLPQERFNPAIDPVQGAGQRAVDQTLERMAEGAADLRDRFDPMAERLGERAADMGRQGADWMSGNGERMRASMARTSDRTVRYVRDQPMRSMLLATAAGAALFALARLMSGRSDRER